MNIIDEIEQENLQIQERLKYLVGSRYVPSVKAYISELTGRPRVFGPGDATTKEYDLRRILVISYPDDSSKAIRGFHFA